MAYGESISGMLRVHPAVDFVADFIVEILFVRKAIIAIIFYPLGKDSFEENIAKRVGGHQGEYYLASIQ